MLEHIVQGFRTPPMTADDLGLGVLAMAEESHASSSPDAPEISNDHPTIQEIARLAELLGGVILTGPPGTSKSYYAAAAARYIAGEPTRCRFVQFHASYQYEDFVFGYRPTEDGFKEKKGVFLEMIEAADADRDHTFVLVIDELSRADVGRVFGEALTYLERSKRELTFRIAHGSILKVPSNFVIIATMNPFDRGVDEVDAAFERRFAKISMDPDRAALEEILVSNGVSDSLLDAISGWFARMQNHSVKNPAAAVGHAYFSSVTDLQSLQDVWEYQLKYLVQRAFRRDENTRSEVEAAWKRIFARVEQELDEPNTPQNS